MKVLSLFSGVGGFDMGLENAGMETVFQCEWDKHANSILHRHWPNVPKWDDVSTLTGKHILANAPVVDVVAWGSPCQDLSVAGKRAGLEGGRSGLFHEGIRIIKELQEESNGQYPRISIWENVVGALNSNRGADFGVILDQMAQAGALVIEWAVLDAQYFGIPQRRRRVFVIAIFDPVLAERSPIPLLPVSESLPGHLAKGKPSRKSAASETATSIGTSFTPSSFGNYSEGVGTLRSNGGDLGGGSETLLSFDTQFGSNANVTEDVAPTLKSSQQSPSVAYPIDTRNALRNPEKYDAQNRQGLGIGNDGDPMSTLTSAHVNAVAFDEFNHSVHKTHHSLRTIGISTGVLLGSEVAATLRSGGDGGIPSSRGEHLVTEDITSPTLTAYNMDSRSPQSEEQQRIVNAVFESTMAVRRLTPLECERLMGWPDNHTLTKADGTTQADTHRYKQCGNGVASPVAQWIAKHILAI
jgi:DNA (cytosine-5)-methyltransferase 1